MDYHVEEETDLELPENDTIDFVPDPALLARPPRPASRMTPRWVIAAAVLAGVAIMFIALSMRPGPSIARAATPPEPAVRVLVPEPSDKIDLFVLPPFNDEAAEPAK